MRRVHGRLGSRNFLATVWLEILLIPVLATIVLVVVHGFDLFSGLESWLGRSGPRSWVPALLVAVPVTLIGLFIVGWWRFLESRRMIRDAGALNRVLVEQASDGVVVVDPTSRIISTNDLVCRFTGYSRDELVGRSIYDLVDTESLDRHPPALKYVLAGKPLRVERFLTSADGKRHLIEATASLMNDGNILVLGRDVTERHRTAEKLRSARDEAEAANRAKSEFLANMSHEIRTPLNGIIGPSQLLLESDDEDEQRAYAEIIQSAGSALMELVDGILDFSKIESGRIDLMAVPFDLKDLVRDVVTVVGEKARRRGVATQVRFEAQTPLRVVGDDMRIRQVITNLVGNAVKFTEEGHINVAVECLDLTAERGIFRLSVEDTGPGIPADQIDTIFDKFSQGDLSTTRQYGGTGLGLAICRLLAELMDGEVGVHSRPGQGSVFWMELPLGVAVEAPQLEVVAGSGGDEVAGVPESPMPRKVLLVEDNEDNRRVVDQMLHLIGIDDIDHAPNGRVALDLIEKTAYDVVLMDCMMPVMDGYEATSLLRAREGSRRRTPVIAITACAMKQDRERCLDVGMDDYIAKPLTQTALQTALGRAVRTRA